MNKKQELRIYLMDEISKLEKERGYRMTMTEFATLIDTPLRTVTRMFDPDDDRVPIEAHAAKIAIAFYSNRVMRILGYKDVDPMYLKFKKAYDRLPTDNDRIEILDDMEARVKEEGTIQPAII